MAEGAPAEEELLAALDRVAVADVLVQALAASASIGFRRVSDEARDLAQVRLAVEALRALEPVLRDGGVEDALVRDLEQARTNLQLAYAKAVVDDGAAEAGDERGAAEGVEQRGAAEGVEQRGAAEE